MYKFWKECSSIQIPKWLCIAQAVFQSKIYLDDLSKMELVLECAERNVLSHFGAPLAAAVFAENGKLISIGVDGPGMGGHEMSNALLIASNSLGSPVLRSSHDWEMFSVAPPCQVCQGNIYSERPKRFVCAVTEMILLKELSLPHTLFPDAGWVRQLEGRGIQVAVGTASEAGRKVLQLAL